MSQSDRITSIEQLEALYGAPSEKAVLKEIDHVSDHYRAFIEHSPFVVVATCGPEGLDCSPRGDPAGFVRVADARTLMVPDRRGNNRVDSLRNIVRDPRVSLLFLVPGVGETLRVIGRASIVTGSGLLESFEMHGKPPRSVIVVDVERVYFQCQKALARSRLWHADARVERSRLPSAGQILAGLSTQAFDADAYDRAYPRHMRETIY